MTLELPEPELPEPELPDPEPEPELTGLEEPEPEFPDPELPDITGLPEPVLLALLVGLAKPGRESVCGDDRPAVGVAPLAAAAPEPLVLPLLPVAALPAFPAVVGLEVPREPAEALFRI